METIMQHPIACVVGYFLYSAIVGGMPAPEATDGRGYQWLYRSSHIIAGNLTTAVSTRFPQLGEGTVAAQHSVVDTVVKEDAVSNPKAL